MPINLSGPLRAALGLETTTLCTLWQIVRRDGTAYYFTDHDETIVFGGETYQVGVGYNRNAIEDKSDLSVDEMNVQGIINLSDITKEDVRGQRFDGAEVTLTLVDYKNLGLGGVIRRKGWFGELKQNSQGEFDVELRGLSQALSENITRPYTPACPVDLGSPACGIPLVASPRTDGGSISAGTFFSVPEVSNLIFQAQNSGTFDDDTGFDVSPYTSAVLGQVFIGENTLQVRAFTKFFRSFTVTSVASLRQFTIAGAGDPVVSDPTYFNGGLISFLTGNNNAISKEVSSYAAGVVRTYIKMPFPVQVGDTGIIYPACNKSIPVCKSRFGNVVNFQGYPHVPGDKYLRDYPDAK